MKKQILMWTFLSYVCVSVSHVEDNNTYYLNYKPDVTGLVELKIEGVNEGSSDSIVIYEWNEGDVVPEKIPIPQSLEPRFFIKTTKFDGKVKESLATYYLNKEKFYGEKDE